MFSILQIGYFFNIKIYEYHFLLKFCRSAHTEDKNL